MTGAYIGVDGTARNVTGAYVGVDGQARKITKAYVGVNGVAQLWWAAEEPSAPIVLEVEKVTSNTYAAETTYENEQFILLDIYPKTNGTVSVAYGGLTKTVTDTSGAAEPNAHQVFFGTFNGVSDSVETPESGILTIEGDCRGAGCSSFNTAKVSSSRASCITAVRNIDGVEFIPDGAFSKCVELTKIDIPNSVTTIGDNAFSQTNLTNVDIPNSVTTIGNLAFLQTNLTNVDIPSGVTNIKNQNPWALVGLNRINVDSNNEHFEVDGGCLIRNSDNRLICGVSNGLIPNYVAIISDYSFSGCSALTKIDIPNSVTTIGNFAFTETGLTSITIPSSVADMESSNIFSNCNDLTNITMLHETPPVIYSDTFASIPNLVSITVPKGCGGTYKAAANWSTYADYIVEVS